jgi:uncharacterized coiled-coil protein SlyX
MNPVSKVKGRIMTPMVQPQKAILLFLLALGLACFWLVPQVCAVSPAPDGGYPGGNTAEGQNALFSLTTGGFNTAVGFFSLRSDTSNSFNTAIGAGTLLANSADGNTATGAGALLSNTTGFANTAEGSFTLLSNTTGSFNTAIGGDALYSNSTGSFNTAIGQSALSSNTVSSNTAIGASALLHNTTGNGNIALGHQAGFNVTTANNVICIGHNGADMDDTIWISNIFGITTQSGMTMPVLVSNEGQLGTASSSRWFKKDIQPMDKASESILALKPVRFHYRSDQSNTAQFGLVAEEVAAVASDLVVRDKNGGVYSVRYDAVNAMLLNEFLKEHKKVDEQQGKIEQQQATIAELKSTVAGQEKRFAQQQKQIAALTSGLQKVSAQLQAGQAAPQLADNE